MGAPGGVDPRGRPPEPSEPSGPSEPSDSSDRYEIPEPGSLARSAAVMAVGTALSRVTGLGRLIALAFALGIAESRLADSYSIANVLPNILYELVLGGILSAVFIPIVVEQLRTRSRQEADEAISALATVSIAALVVLSLVTLLAAPWIVRLFTFRLPGEEAAQQHALATFFLRCFVAQVTFYGIAAIGGGLLNAHHRFAVPMYAPILNNVVVISTFLIFAATVGSERVGGAIEGNFGAKLLLGLGTTAGVAAMACAYLPSVMRLPVRLRPRFDLRHPAVRSLARLSGWTIGYVVANQLGLAIVLIMANGVQGGPTAYFTAFTFFQLPYGIAAVSIMTALVPRLAAQAVDKDHDSLRATLANGLRTIGLLMLPASTLMIALARPLVATLLEHGIVTKASGSLVTGVLQCFAVGLLPFSVFLLLIRTLYALKDSRTPMLVNLLANAVFVAGAAALYPAFDIRGLALGHSLSYVVGAIAAATTLRRRLGHLGLGTTIEAWLRMAAASTAAGIAAALAISVTSNDVLDLVVGGVAAAITFLLASRLVGLDAVADLRKEWRR